MSTTGQIQHGAWASEEEPLMSSASLTRAELKQKRRWRVCYCLVGIGLLLLIVSIIVTAGVLVAAQQPIVPPSCATNCTMTIVESIPENLTYPNGSVSQLSTFQSWHSLLKSANYTVDIASFYWTLNGTGGLSDSTDKEGKQIFQDLIDASRRKVTIRVVQSVPTETFPDTDSKALLDMGVIQLRNLNMSQLIHAGILHTKLWVIDGKHFYVGSANMDWRSLTQVKELGLTGTSCDCLAADAQKLFNVYWSLAVSPNDKSDPKLPNHWGRDYNAYFGISSPANMKVNKTSASVYWASSPPQLCPDGRTSDIIALLDVIDLAKKFVYIAVMDYIPAIIYSDPHRFWPDIDNALRRAVYERGVNVRLLGSCWPETSPDMIRYMRSLSEVNNTGDHNGTMEMKLFVVPVLTNKHINYTRVNHNKYMVTDNAAYIGTSNWSGDYFEDTGGVSLTVTQTGTMEGKGNIVQKQLVTIFNRDWDSQYTHDLDYAEQCMNR